MRRSNCLAGIAGIAIFVAGCQLGDDTPEPVERAAPPALVVGAEKALDVAVPGYLGAGPSLDSHVAWNRRTRNFVVWRAERLTETGIQSEIWGAFLGGSGMLTPGAFLISRRPGPYHGLAVATRPGSGLFEFMVTWRTDDVETTAIYRINDRSLVSYDEAPAPPPPEHADEAFASYGSRSLHVWIDAGGAVVAQRHTGAAFVVSDGAGAKSDVDVDRANANWVVTWRNGDDVHMTRVLEAPTGGGPLDTHLEGATVVGGVAITGAGVQSHPELACANENTGGIPDQCLVVYEDDRNTATTGLDLYATRFTVQPTLVLPGTEVALSTAPGDDLLPAASHGDKHWVVSWSGAGHALATTITDSATLGAVIELDGVQPRNAERDPAVAATSLGELIVWSDTRTPGGGDIVGVRYSYTGAKLDATAFTIAGAAGEQTTPATDHDGVHYVVAWSDGRAGEPTIRAAEVGLDGVVVQPDGLALSAAAGFQTHPAVASDNGSNATLVVWEDRRNLATTGIDLYGAVIAAGAVFVPEFPICTAPGDQRRPTATFHAATARFLVAWSDGRGADADVYAARVSIVGATPDGNGVALTVGLGDQVDPDIAVHGGVPLVAWEDHRTATSQVFATRISLAGAPAPVTPGGVLIAGAGAKEPQVAAMENDAMLIAWLEPRTFDVAVGRMMSDTGDLGPPLDLAVADDAGQLGLALPVFNTLPFKLSIAYARLRPSYAVTRVFRRIVSTLRPLGNVCTNADQCDSELCVDGVCCDDACGGTDNFDCQACSVAKGSSTNGSCEIVTDLRVCRKNADPFCDTRELCDGSAGAHCPVDVGQHGGDPCTAACGAGVCPPADETGSPHACDCP